MDKKEIFEKVDHTLLTQTATWEEIKQICDDAMTYQTASVCIPASYVKRAKDYVENNMQICTVIGFPNGYSTTKVKEFETKDAIENGADEIDMVINIGDLKDKRYHEIENEIKALKAVCGNKILIFSILSIFRVHYAKCLKTQQADCVLLKIRTILIG